MLLGGGVHPCCLSSVLFQLTFQDNLLVAGQQTTTPSTVPYTYWTFTLTYITLAGVNSDWDGLLESMGKASVRDGEGSIKLGLLRDCGLYD